MVHHFQPQPIGCFEEQINRNLTRLARSSIDAGDEQEKAGNANAASRVRTTPGSFFSEEFRELSCFVW
jgi:hypothetical protein